MNKPQGTCARLKLSLVSTRYSIESLPRLESVDSGDMPGVPAPASALPPDTMADSQPTAKKKKKAGGKHKDKKKTGKKRARSRSCPGTLPLAGSENVPSSGGFINNNNNAALEADQGAAEPVAKSSSPPRKVKIKPSLKLPKIQEKKGSKSATLSDTNLRKSPVAQAPVRMATTAGPSPHQRHPAAAAPVSAMPPCAIPSENISEETDKKATKPNTERRVPILIAIKPENQETEKERFMKSNYHANPQFAYKHPIHAATMERMSQPSNFLLPLVSLILSG